MAARNGIAGICLTGLAQWALAQIAVAGFPIPGHIESATKGHFVELTLAIAKEAGVAIDIQIAPPSRAIESFLQGKSQVLFPALDAFFPTGQPPVRTRVSLTCKQDFVFTKKGMPALSRLDDLKGKRLGLTRGYPYGKEVMQRTDVAFETAPTDEVNVEKLMKGHLDGFLVEKASGVQAFENVHAVADMQVDYSRPVSQQDVYWAFQNTPQGRDLAQQFDQAFAKLQKQKSFYQRFKVGVIDPAGCKHERAEMLPRP